MDEKYMKLALVEAKKAYNKNEVPVGAIIVKNDVIVAKAHNCKVTTNMICGHAEMLAIQKASKKLGDWRLNDCVMYVTLEPCPMCASAIQQSRIRCVYIGAPSNLKSNRAIVNDIFNNNEFYHKVKTYDMNVLGCSNILTAFFAQKR